MANAPSNGPRRENRTKANDGHVSHCGGRASANDATGDVDDNNYSSNCDSTGDNNIDGDSNSIPGSSRCNSFRNHAHRQR
jgi:hypothetical protein